MPLHPKKIKPKKHLGQHFLQDFRVAEKIIQSLNIPEDAPLVEVGPGKGILTRYLMHRKNFLAFEVDTESLAFLKENYPEQAEKFILKDFLQVNPETVFNGREWHIIGNFPYHLSGHLLEYFYRHRRYLLSVTGMFQKEVAERICAAPGNKSYGIFSVLLQPYYHCNYLFTVKEGSFHPPPRVRSGVIRMERYRVSIENLKEEFFEKLVRTAFQQRRKIMGNALSAMPGIQFPCPLPFNNKRPEQLHPDDFIHLSRLLDNNPM